MQESTTEKAVAKFSVNKNVTIKKPPTMFESSSQFQQEEKGTPETFTKRDRRPSTAACPSCWGMGVKGIEIVYGEEKLFCSGPA
jgi:hypothetical protein